MDRIEKLLAFLRESPDDSFLKHALALEYIKSGDEGGAENLFRELLQADPGYVGSYYHLGKLLERKGDVKGAVMIYEKGVAAARAAGEKHSEGELRGALDELTM